MGKARRWMRQAVISWMAACSLSGTVRAEELNAPPEMLATEQGRQLLRYIVQCALDEHQHLSATVDGVVHAFDGQLGLAPNWLKEALTPMDQRWVSACVLARTNYFGVRVPLSLQGDHPVAALRSRDEVDQKRYPIEEGAFFGNLFQANPVAYTCRGRGPMLAANPWVRKRVCTETLEGAVPLTRCQFVLAGACEAVCARRNPVSGAYESCKGPDGQVYAEVLTTYLMDQE